LERLTKWLSHIHPLLLRTITIDDLLQLPVWREFPDIRILVDTTLHPSIRPSLLQSFCYNLDRAKHGLISLLWTDILGHILAIETGFAAIMSDADVLRSTVSD
jgi:hypothetical protein